MKPQIIVFEGLLSTYIKKLLLPKIKGEYDLYHHSCFSKGPTDFIDKVTHDRLIDIIGINKIISEHKKIIIAAHSMGVKPALAWCNRNPHIKVDLFLGLDGRPFGRPYITPSNVKKCVNLYRPNRWWMEGYPIEYAQNYQVHCGHGEVPGHEIAVSTVNEILNRRVDSEYI